MAWDLEAREFNSVERAGLLAEALGELVPDLLGQFTISNVAYVLDESTSPTTYEMTFEVLEGTTSETVNFTYTSTGSETTEELLNLVVEEGNSVFGDYLYWDSNTDYTNPVNMYFTVTTKEGYRLTANPTLVNITNTEDTVQTPIGKPAAYSGYIDSPTADFPRLVVTPMPITSVSENSRNGTINLGTELVPDYKPYFDAYIKANFKVTVEAGGYTDIQKNGNTAEDILRKIKMKLREDNRHKAFLEKIDATINRDWNILPAPSLQGVDWTSVASTTITLDIIERYVEMEGGYITAVVIENDSVLTGKEPNSPEIPVGQIIERPDHN